MKYYKINDKLVKANSLKSAIGLVKDSAASDIVTAIKNMGRGFKLVNQTSYKYNYGRTSKFIFKSSEINDNNLRRIEREVLNTISKLGHKYVPFLKRFVTDRSGGGIVQVEASISKDTLEIKVVEYDSKVSNKVKDSAASDVVGAINGLGQGWKLTKQTSQKENGVRRSHLEFKHDKFVNGNIPKMVKELERAFQKLGYKESRYGDFVNQRNGNILTPDYYNGMASILIFEKGSTKDAAIKTEYSYKGYKIIYTYGSFTIYSGYDEIASGFYSVNEAKEYINNYVIKNRK